MTGMLRSQRAPRPGAVPEGDVPEVRGPEATGREATGQGDLPPLPPAAAAWAVARCAATTVALLAGRRLHQPATHVGRELAFADGTTASVYRETVVDRGPTAEPAVLVVCFRLRHVRGPFGHALFRRESELNTILFAGFPGLVSKLWLAHDRTGRYRGLYEWDGAERAAAYARALWWVLALVSERDSIHWRVLPGLGRDQVLADPALMAGTCWAGPADGWWRLAAP